MLFGALNINQSRLARQSSRLDASRAFATSSLDLESRPRPILSPPRPDPLPHPSRARVVERTFGPDRTKSSSSFLSAFFVLTARSRSLRMCAAWRRSASSLRCARSSLSTSRARRRARPVARDGRFDDPRRASRVSPLARASFVRSRASACGAPRGPCPKKWARATDAAARARGRTSTLVDDGIARNRALNGLARRHGSERAVVAPRAHGARDRLQIASGQTRRGRRLHLVGAIHQGDARRSRGDDSGRARAGILQTDVSIVASRRVAGVCVRRSAPALKRRTAAARRRMRDESAAKVRKAAEKVLLNALKQKALRDGVQGVGRRWRKRTTRCSRNSPLRARRAHEDEGRR